MSIETIIETVIVSEAVCEPGGIETVVESAISTELVTEHIGPAGPQGLPGPSGQANGLDHTQAVPALLWVILHGYANEPLVAVKDASGSEVLAGVTHPEPGLTHIVFARPTAGRARLI